MEVKLGIGRAREKLLSDVRQLPPGPQALKKLADVRREYDWEIPDYRNTLNILSDTTYQDRKHFLLELIQNADDAQFATEQAGLSIIIQEDSLELRYNEQGFNVEDVIAITGAGVSTKSDKKRLAHSFIGEKGIGFKSVFALATSVEVESPPWHFILRKERCIIPEVLESGELRKGQGTRLKVRFLDSAVIDAIAAELSRYVSGQVESFLFLQRLANFRVEDRRKNQTEERGLTLLPPDRSEDKLLLTTFPDGMMREYILYREDAEFPAALVAGRWERLGLEIGSLKRQMVVAALVKTTGDRLPDGRLFCFLPTAVTLPVPLFLQIDGHTKADRERLHDPIYNEWNSYLLKILPDFLLRAIMEWRDRPDIAGKLPVYVPISAGNDQLAPVFENLMELLKNASWVRTFDREQEGWTTPEKAVMVPEFWAGWFKAYPGFREQAEKLLGKKFVHPGWAAKPEWKKKLDQYGIHEINEKQIVLILADLKLPREMLVKEENLVALYRQILALPSMKEQTAQARTLTPFIDKLYSNREEVKKHLLRAPIYPFKGGKFGSLQGDASVKVFWLSGASSRRRTGLEGIVTFRIINNEYTYEPKLDGDASPERKAATEKVKVRNEMVRKLLNQLGVKELSDENILSELQLPWLIKQSQRDFDDSDQRFEILAAIFDSYRAKRTKEKDDDFLKELAKLSNALFPAESGRTYQLKKMVLPEVLRFEQIDRLYGKSGLEALGIPEKFLEPPPSKAKLIRPHEERERRRKVKEEWRQFLIHCGIRNGPQFILHTKKYNSSWVFEEENKYYFNLWQKARVSFTRTRPLELVTVELDDGTRDLLNNVKDNLSLLSLELYKEWMRKFHKELHYLNNWPYWQESLNPPSGFFIVRYVYRGRRSALVKDTHWGMIEKEWIPIKTINGDIVSSREALRVPLLSKLKLKISSRYLPLVLENEIGEAGFHTAYLDSLEIRKPKITDVNTLWERLEEKNYPEVLRVAIEFLEADIVGVGLKLYDKETGSLRPASDFRLGRECTKGVPLIERQYGEVGRKLGELLGLPEENEISSFLGFFENVFSTRTTNLDDFASDLYRILKHWPGWDAASRGIIANDLKSALDNHAFELSPIVVFNNPGMLANLRNAGIVVFGLKIEDDERYGLETSVRELGLLLPEDAGRLEVDGKKPLDEEELRRLNQLFHGYISCLDLGEKSRLTSLFEGAGLGSFESIGKKVLRVDSIARVVGQKNQVVVSLRLPYLDSQNQRFYITPSDKTEVLLAYLLSISGFTRFKSAILEIKEIVKGIKDVTPMSAPVGKVASGRKSPGNETTVSSCASFGMNNFTGKTAGKEVAENTLAITFDNDEYNGITDISSASDKADKTVLPETGEALAADPGNSPSSLNGVNAGTETAAGRSPENHGININDVVSAVKSGFVDTRPVPTVGRLNEGWNTGLTPEEEVLLREKIGERLLESLKAGPEFYERKLRARVSKSSNTGAKENLKMIDPGAADPKAFLQGEYGGRCQICATELILRDGRKWFNIFRIFEPRGVDWWTDRPFNILSLCPNCHALAKHGGRDMSNIYNVAKEALQGSTFPVEMSQYQGDFYVVPVIINEFYRELVISKVHMGYFVELFKTDEEVAVTCER